MNKLTIRDRFSVLDLTAIPDFAGPSSFSVQLANGAASGQAFDIIGWADVHHPCDGQIKARLRVVLPARYHSTVSKTELIRRLFEVAGIPADETFEATFLQGSGQSVLVKFKDRNGNADRLV